MAARCYIYTVTDTLTKEVIWQGTAAEIAKARGVGCSCIGTEYAQYQKLKYPERAKRQWVRRLETDEELWARVGKKGNLLPDPTPMERVVARARQDTIAAEIRGKSCGPRKSAAGPASKVYWYRYVKAATGEVLYEGTAAMLAERCGYSSDSAMRGATAYNMKQQSKGVKLEFVWQRELMTQAEARKRSWEMKYGKGEEVTPSQALAGQLSPVAGASQEHDEALAGECLPLSHAAHDSPPERGAKGAAGSREREEGAEIATSSVACGAAEMARHAVRYVGKRPKDVLKADRRDDVTMAVWLLEWVNYERRAVGLAGKDYGRASLAGWLRFEKDKNPLLGDGQPVNVRERVDWCLGLIAKWRKK